MGKEQPQNYPFSRQDLSRPDRPNLPVESVVMETKHCQEVVKCSCCDGPTESVKTTFERWGKKVIFQVTNFPVHYCPSCDIEITNTADFVEFFSKAVQVFTIMKDKSSATAARQELSLAEANLAMARK